MRVSLLAVGIVVALVAVLWAAAPPAVAWGQETTEATAPPAAEATAAEAPAETTAAEEAPAYATLDQANTLWTVLAACLVFFMQAGFAMVETGFTRAKNACNILMKNMMDLSVGSVLFWAIGFGIMFGATNPDVLKGLVGTDNFAFDATRSDVAAVGNTPAFSWAFLFFQTVFCATAATIVSGAMAERTKFVAYLIYSAAICAIVYPVFGAWAWGGLWKGGGWLEGMSTGFYDFAGSTVVHSVGGWAALAGAIVLGPRLGKYSKDGKINPIPGHSIPLGALGVFILWLGWFGFNPGSTTAVDADFAFIAVNTNLAACTGAIATMITTWVWFKKPDPSLTLNGALAGLVAITSGCDAMAPYFALLTGAVAGVVVVFAVRMFDRIRVDDPVGAVSVHGVCGAWGTLATGLFMTEGGLVTGGGAAQLLAQAIGIGAAFIWAFPASMLIFLTLKYTVGLRVSPEEEIEGLDPTEHGLSAYPPVFVADHFIGSGTSHVPAGLGIPSQAAASMQVSTATEGA